MRILMFGVWALLMLAAASWLGGCAHFDGLKDGLSEALEERKRIEAAVEEAKGEVLKAEARYESLAEEIEVQKEAGFDVSRSLAELKELGAHIIELKAVAENGEARRLVDDKIARFKELIAEAEKNPGGPSPWTSILGYVLGALGVGASVFFRGKAGLLAGALGAVLGGNEASLTPAEMEKVKDHNSKTMPKKYKKAVAKSKEA